MESNSAEIQQLRSRLDVLIHKQTQLRGNFNELQAEIRELHGRIEKLAQIDKAKAPQPRVEKVEPPKTPIIEEKVPEPTADKLPPIMQAKVETPKPAPVIQKLAPAVPQKQIEKSSIESFLGENLANKIGIAVILIGIGVGVKYAIDKNILGPAMRIALGYLAGAILIGFAIYLKKKYENLSAVMFAGGMAVAYFVTFIAHDLYELIPKLVAFGSMVVFTVVTSLAAIRYNKQIIAIVGLVGAYAVPFLLSDGSGTTFALLAYMTIINAGILFLAFRKNWQPVFAVTFSCTWLIFLIMWIRAAIWLESDYETLLLFGSVFYVMFYAMLIVNKMKYKEQLSGGGTTIVILNSIFGYLFGIILTNAIYDDSNINGIFSLVFAASQGLVTFITHKQKEADHRLYYLSFGFALIYATLSIPMIFDGNWITILWSLQAALFFWISYSVAKEDGWKQNDSFFERITYIPLFLAFISLFASWSEMNSLINPYFYEIPAHITPVLNEYFLAGIVLVAALFFMAYIKQSSKKISKLSEEGGLFAFLSNSLLYLGMITLYFVVVKEIDIYWDQLRHTPEYTSEFQNDYFSSTGKIKSIWILIFSLVYTGALQLVNRYILKNKTLSMVLGIISGVAVLAFLLIGLYTMSLLRDRALEGLYGHKIAEYALTFSIRYIGFTALGFVLWANWYSLRHFFTERIVKQGIEIVIHVCLVWVICSELIHLKKMNGGGDLYRAGLTVFGGIYSFGLIAFGIWKKKAHLRLLALVLFGITLLKLFIYDIATVNSGGKTIAFISLGILLLVVSFLYTKYKHLILPSAEEEEKKEKKE